MEKTLKKQDLPKKSSTLHRQRGPENHFVQRQTENTRIKKRNIVPNTPVKNQENKHKSAMDNVKRKHADKNTNKNDSTDDSIDKQF